MASKSDEMAKIESLSSAAAFVEGGVQDACEDACSICLEAFCDSDPSTLTGCKHEFHLQCILEWCQRSSQCPMCWQPISLKDPSSQELLEAVEQERNIRSNQTQNTTIFHHPALGDFDLQHLPIVGNDAELEERILQHIAAAAAMGRAHHLTRREGHRGRSGSHGRPQFFVFSTHPNMPSAGSISSSSSQREGVVESSPVATGVGQLSPHTGPSEEPSNQSPRTITSADQDAVVTPRNDSPLSSPRFLNSRRSSAGQSTPVNNDRAGSSDLQSFSDSLKSRLNAVSMRYKESITKSTRGWKEKLFSRNTSVTDLGSEVRREVNAGIASVSRMMERFETRGNRSNGASTTSTTEVPLTAEVSNERVAGSNSSNDANTSNTSSPCVATSGSN